MLSLVKYCEILPEKCENIDRFLESFDLFSCFETPINLIFVDQFAYNISKFTEVFCNYFMGENIFFSCKSNKSYALLKCASDKKCGIEVSSNYELIDALKFSKKIIASGPAKGYEYLMNAIDNSVVISVDDIEELKIIKEINRKTKVMLRISNLLNEISRFGINISQINECLDMISKSKIEFEGFSFHMNNYSLCDRVSAIKYLVNLMNVKKINAKYIDIGGGIPSNYCERKDFEWFKKNNNYKMYFKDHFVGKYYPYYSDLADEQALDYILKNTCDVLKNNNLNIIIEPGRSLLKNVGVTIYGVQYLKRLFNGDNLIVTNGNINTLSEQWFDSDYLISPKLILKEPREKEEIFASVAGNLCLEQDMMTWRKIKFDCIPKRGDRLIYFNTAAYQMDSNESEFHKIPLVKKLVVRKSHFKYILEEDKKYDS